MSLQVKEAARPLQPRGTSGFPPVEFASYTGRILETYPRDGVRSVSDGTQYDLQNYMAYRDRMDSQIGQLRRSLTDIFQQRRAGTEDLERVEDTITHQTHTSTVTKAEIGNLTQDSYAFTLLVDLSGSMGEPAGSLSTTKIEETFKGVVALSEALDAVGIKTRIVGFNDRLHLFKTADQRVEDVRQQMGTMLREVSTERAEYNDDGWAIQEEANRLGQQEEKVKALLVFSDGRPVESDRHKGWQYDLSRVAREVTKDRQKGVLLLGIGLGPGTEHVSRYYPNHEVIPDMDKFADTIGANIQELVQRPDKF